jgi:hypothetical protein
VRIVDVRHPTRGNILQMSPDLTLDPLCILQDLQPMLQDRVGFKQDVHTVGTYAYRFWVCPMKKKINRGSGNQYLHRESEKYRQDARGKVRAYHNHIQLGVIVQGLLHYLAITHRRAVWHNFHIGNWFRTMKTHATPIGTHRRPRARQLLRRISGPVDSWAYRAEITRSLPQPRKVPRIQGGIVIRGLREPAACELNIIRIQR